MSVFNKIDCILGDSFFFKAAEIELEKILSEQYNMKNIMKDFVFIGDDSSKLNQSLLPNIFDLEPKIVILRNIKSKFIESAINNLKTTKNVYLLIEMETEQLDKRVKVFKELEKNNCIHNLGFAYYNEDKIFLAFNKMENILGINIDDDIKQFLIDYVPKLELNNKPIHNLNRIFSEIKKINSYGISLEACENLINKQKYVNIFSITEALANKNAKLVLEVIDNHITDLNSSKQILSLIISEIKIICSIKNVDLPFNQLYENINDKSGNYNLLEDIQKENKYKPVHPYRLQKILEKKNTSYFKNCDKNLELCIKAYNDLNEYYQDNFTVPIIKLCLDIIG